ncbi:ABC transporter substrate-binding protein [Streptomyces sp. NPDC056231]|uniref:ABC transporter substrate-binding protein n=1 Tax=Streptomyces sp. NPDC056231 TaxID=3345755 RepID=UPI003AB0EE61
MSHRIPRPGAPRPGRPRRRSTTTVLTALTACTALALSACGGVENGVGKRTGTPELTESMPPAKSGVESLRWALYAEPSSLDPIYSNDFPPMEVLANVCESLLRIDPDFSFQPSLAASWTNPDPLTWVYQLREGVTFHSGAPMTAEDVAYSLGRNLDKSLGSYHDAVYKNVDSIAATGDREITVKLKKPDAQFNQAMATPAGRVVGKAESEKAGKKLGRPDGGVDCTGPFRLADWSAGKSITIERFDGYWDAKRAAKPAKVEFEFIRDPAARTTAMLAGELDGSWFVPASGYGKLLAQGGDGGTADAGGEGNTSLYFGRTSGSYVGMVTDLKGPLADVKIRKALSLAIDRKGIISAAVSGAAEPLKAPAAPGTWGYAQPELKAAYEALPDPSGPVEEAKKLVAEAGAPAEPITIAVTGSQSEMPVIGTEIKRAGESIGLKVDIKTLPADNYNALYSDAKAREGIDMLFSLWQADYPDPTAIYQYLQTGDTFNFAQWSDPEFDRLINEAKATADNEQRAELIVQAQKIAVDQSIWIPLYTPFNPLYLNPDLTGAPLSSVQLTYPWAADIGGRK